MKKKKGKQSFQSNKPAPSKPMGNSPSELAKHYKPVDRSKFKYDLTIGMIVKNDRDNLKVCLETMMPLRNAINCQLIITDTGSTDDSRDIAEEYADILLDFEWIDDFSAARNTGIEIAEGRWFMYVDSDHEFDDSILEIAKFLESKESDFCDSAKITIHNQLGSRDKAMNYSIEHKPLLANFSYSKRYFKYAIHETMDFDTEFLGEIDCIVTHWGYVNEVQNSKRSRNTPLLLKAIEKEPEVLKHHSQLLRETTVYPQRREYALLAIKIGSAAKRRYEADNKEYPDEKRLSLIYLDLFYTTVQLQDYVLYEEVDAYLKGKYPNTIIEMEYLGIKTLRLLREPLSNQLVETFLQYKRAFQKENSTPDLIYGMLSYFYFKEEEKYLDAELKLLSKIAIALEDARKKENGEYAESNNCVVEAPLADEEILYYSKHALDILKTSNASRFKISAGTHPFMEDFLIVSHKLQAYDALVDSYRYHVDKSESNELHEHRKRLELIYLNYSEEEQAEMTSHFAGTNLDTYTLLYDLRKADFQPEAFTPELISKFQSTPELYTDISFSDLLYGYITTMTDPTGYVEQANFDFLLQRINAYFLQKDKKFIESVANFSTIPLENITFESLKEQKLWAYISHAYLLHLSEDEENTQEIRVLFPRVVILLQEYVYNIYQEHILTFDLAKDFLPTIEYFSFYGAKALALEQNNPLEYVRVLKDCFKFYPQYTKLVKLLSTAIVDNPSVSKPIQNTPSSELEILAHKVKENIKFFTENGDFATAHAFIAQYKTICVDDEEIQLLVSALTNKEESAKLSQMVKENILTFIKNGDLQQAKLFLGQYKTINPNDPDIPSLLQQLS